MSEIKTNQEGFKYWCENVLPSLYSDNLNYYELLVKVVDYLNDVISDLKTENTNIDKLYESFDGFKGYNKEQLDKIVETFEKLQGYVNDYFSGLDVQEEINKKLDNFAKDDTLTNLIAPFAKTWISENISTDGTIVVDESLSVSGAAADSKVTGDKIDELKEDLNVLDASIKKTSNNLFNQDFNGTINGISYVNGVAQNYRINSSGVIIEYEGNNISYPIPIGNAKTLYTYKITSENIFTKATTSRVAFYDKNYNYIKDSYATAQNNYTVPSNAKYVIYCAEFPSYQCFGDNVITMVAKEDNLTEYEHYINEVVNVIKLENQLSVIDSDKVKEYSALFENISQSESFLFFTDPHLMGSNGKYDNTKFNQYIDKLKSVYKISPCDFIMCGGDWLINGDTKAQACYKLSLIGGTMKDLFSNSYMMVGNHDTNYQGYDYIQDSTKYKDCMLNNGAISNLMGMPTNTYYSFNGRNCKYYVLDTGIDWWDWITDDRKNQMDWLAEQLKSDDPIHATIFMHIASNSLGEPTVFSDGIGKMISGFNEHKLTDSINGVYYDFTGTTGHIDFVMAGHTHKDYIITLGNVPCIITTTFGSSETATQPTFDLCLVDYDNKMLKCVRVGDGSNRSVQLI